MFARLLLNQRTNLSRVSPSLQAWRNTSTEAAAPAAAPEAVEPVVVVDLNATSGEEWEKDRNTHFFWKAVLVSVIVTTTLVEARMFEEKPATFLHLGNTREENENFKATLQEKLRPISRIFSSY